MSVSLKDLFRFEPTPFLLGVLFSRIVSLGSKDIPEYFQVYTHFKTSKAVKFNEFDFENYGQKLITVYDQASGYENWEIQSSTNTSLKLTFKLKNDLDLTLESLNNLVHKKLMQSDWLYEDSDDLTENQKMFVRGFMETRGSVDTSARYITQDFYYNNRIELKRLQVFVDFLNLPIPYLNFNPRQLQDDFTKRGIERNTQFRINSFYYAKNIGFMNKYKALVFENTFHVSEYRYVNNSVIYYDLELPSTNYNTSFIKYINFFSNNIYQQELTSQKISLLRENLGFNNRGHLFDKGNRNQTIVALFDQISPDKCGLCGTTETFTRKATGRAAFEIHHMIPYHNGKQFDNIANLVKLCSVCHDSLKRGRATKEQQIKNITRILHNNPEIFEYTSTALGIDNITELSDKIYTMLG